MQANCKTIYNAIKEKTVYICVSLSLSLCVCIWIEPLCSFLLLFWMWFFLSFKWNNRLYGTSHGNATNSTVQLHGSIIFSPFCYVQLNLWLLFVQSRLVFFSTKSKKKTWHMIKTKIKNENSKVTEGRSQCKEVIWFLLFFVHLINANAQNERWNAVICAVAFRFLDVQFSKAPEKERKCTPLSWSKRFSTFLPLIKLPLCNQLGKMPQNSLLAFKLNCLNMIVSFL